MDNFGGLLGIPAPSAEDGKATLEFDARHQHLNHAGTVHGGVLATLVDVAMGSAVQSSTEDAHTPVTSQLTVAYLRPGEPGRITVAAQVRKQGEHLLVCDAEVQQDDRDLIHAVATFALLPPR